MTEIGISFTFSAAHRLPMVPDGHKCGRMHGHNYTVEVAERGFTRDDGMVRDYAELQRIADDVRAVLDHSTLNDTLDNPTAELLAVWIWRKFIEALRLPGASQPRIAVTVRENARSWARYDGR
jgi:6-pyruvoyltetrahydropterin/6-carboxytetrahydropterin synthase